MRKKLFEIIEVAEGNIVSRVYDIFMMINILISIIPLAFKTYCPIFDFTEKITMFIFIADYLFRWFTADFKLKRGVKSFFLYPFSFMAIIDLISILPYISIFNSSLKLLRLYRLIRTFRILRLLKATRYSKNIHMLVNVFKRSKEPLITLLSLAIIYILISALIIINIEPESFNNYFDAVYWATVSLTTMGYGDIYPVTTAGRIVTIFSAFFGIAIIALPSGIITAAFMEELSSKNKQQ